MHCYESREAVRGLIGDILRPKARGVSVASPYEAFVMPWLGLGVFGIGDTQSLADLGNSFSFIREDGLSANWVPRTHYFLRLHARFQWLRSF
jgi:hypothetical protein